MSYRTNFAQYRDSVMASPEVTPEAKKQIMDAEAKGLKVEMHFSSYSDPGPDWSEVLIADVPVIGSQQGGY